MKKNKVPEILTPEQEARRQRNLGYKAGKSGMRLDYFIFKNSSSAWLEGFVDGTIERLRN